MTQLMLLMPSPGHKRIRADGEHEMSCGCRWCLLDLERAPSCRRCGLRGAHECVPGIVAVAGQRLHVVEFARVA